jgi:hypothetical protein
MDYAAPRRPGSCDQAPKKSLSDWQCVSQPTRTCFSSDSSVDTIAAIPLANYDFHLCSTSPGSNSVWHGLLKNMLCSLQREPENGQQKSLVLLTTECPFLSQNVDIFDPQWY